MTTDGEVTGGRGVGSRRSHRLRVVGSSQIDNGERVAEGKDAMGVAGNDAGREHPSTSRRGSPTDLGGSDASDVEAVASNGLVKMRSQSSNNSRAFRGILTGTRDDGCLTLEFLNCAVALHACPAWSADQMLSLPSLLGPGIYVLVGMGLPGSSRCRAIVGESGMLHERIAAHLADPKLDFVWEVLALVGPRVMNETVRLILQRRLVDEIANHGMAAVANRHDAERFTATEFDLTAASRVLEDARPLLDLALPGLIAVVEPIHLPITARAAGLPRGIDPLGLAETTHEMRWRGAHAVATIRGVVTVLLPGSHVVAEVVEGRKWLVAKRAELTATGVLVPSPDRRHLVVRAYVTFGSPEEATIFVTGGAQASARLTWTPIDAL